MVWHTTTPLCLSHQGLALLEARSCFPSVGFAQIVPQPTNQSVVVVVDGEDDGRTEREGSERRTEKNGQSDDPDLIDDVV